MRPPPPAPGQVPRGRRSSGAGSAATIVTAIATAIALGATTVAARAQTPPDTAGRAPRDSATRALESVRVVETRSAAVTGGTSAVVLRPDALPVPTLPAPPLVEVLRQTPFVLARQNSRGEVELSVRGSESRQAAVLLDGLPLSLGWDHRTDPSLVPTTGVRRLTVVRGLSTLLAGPNTLGGVIALDLNGVGAGPGDPSPADVAARALTLGAGVDQYAARVLSAAGAVPAAAGRAGTLTIRGGGTYRERTGVALSRGGGGGDGITGGAADPGQDDAGRLRTNSDLRQVDGFAAARLESPAGRYVGITTTAYRARRGVAPELHLRDPRLWRYPHTSRRLGILAAGTGELRTPLGRARLDASLGANDGDVEIETFADRAYARVVARELGDERTVVGRAVGSHSLPALGQLRVGATASDVRYDETLDAQLPTTTASRYRQRLSSVGAEVEWPVLARAVVSGGVVRDAADTPETGGKPALGALTRWGWRLGATTAVREAVRFHASASRRARFPALRELYSGALARFEPNPALRPERLLGVEAGATAVSEAVESRGIDIQAVVFHHRLEDAVVRVARPNRLFQRVNRDEIRSTGVELLAGWTPPVLRGVAFSADVAAQRVRVYDRTLAAGVAGGVATGVAAERRPEHQPALRGSLEVGAPIGFGARASALARTTGRQFCVLPDLGRQVELGAQAIADAALSRGWTRRGGRGVLSTLRATVAVDNVADATAYDQCGLPQAGRTLRFGVEVR